MTQPSIRTADALRDAVPRPFWTDRPGAPAPAPPLAGGTSCDVLVVGGGLTGLWAAIEARTSDPSADVVLVEAETIAFGASGRNGGFFSESLTHGIAHGVELWPDDLPALLRLGRQNVREIVDFTESEGIDAGIRLCGKTAVATPAPPPRGARGGARPQPGLRRARRRSSTVRRCSATSPRRRTSADCATARAAACSILRPSRWGLAAAAGRRGVRIHESHRGSARCAGAGTPSRWRPTPAASGPARVVLATNAYPPLLRRLRHRVMPIYDHVLVTEPLSPAALGSIGWAQAQGLTDVGNQFHYYRRTPDDRILWGGYDAIYYFGNRTDAAREQRDASHGLLARQFFQTFPQLEGLRFTHRWAGLDRLDVAVHPGVRHRPRRPRRLHRRLHGPRRRRVALRGARRTRPARRTRHRADEPRPRAPQAGAVPARAAALPGGPGDPRRARARGRDAGAAGAYLRTLDHFGIGFNS